MTNCIWHNDQTPSLSINPQKATYYCFACEAQGSVYSLMGKGSQRQEINPRRISQYIKDLWNQSSQIKYLTNTRGLSLRVIKQYDLGFDTKSNRFTIPIPDAYKKYYYMRKYLPNAQENKMIWAQTGSKDILYPISSIGSNVIFITEGEFDALKLISEGFMAITPTTGAQTSWQVEWNPYFKGKEVYLVGDCDTAGVERDNRIQEALTGIARSVSVVTLPLPFKENHGYDVTDYFMQFHHTKEEFQQLLTQINKTIFYSEYERILIGLYNIRQTSSIARHFLVKQNDLNFEDYDLSQGFKFTSQQEIITAINHVYKQQIKSQLQEIQGRISSASDKQQLLLRQAELLRHMKQGFTHDL